MSNTPKPPKHPREMTTDEAIKHLFHPAVPQHVKDKADAAKKSPVKVSAKHLTAYLDEMTFRFNNRDNPYLFRDTLMKLIEAPVLEYKKLTAAA